MSADDSRRVDSLLAEAMGWTDVACEKQYGFQIALAVGGENATLDLGDKWIGYSPEAGARLSVPRYSSDPIAFVDVEQALHDRGLGEQYAEELWLTLAPSLALHTAANEYARLWSTMRAPLDLKAKAALSVLQSP